MDDEREEVRRLRERRDFIKKAAAGTAILAIGGGLYRLVGDDLTRAARAETRTDGRPRLPPGQRVLAELRPMVRWEALMFRLPRRVESRRIARRPIGPPGAVWHVVNLATPAEFDDDVRAWLTEAYLASPE